MSYWDGTVLHDPTDSFFYSVTCLPRRPGSVVRPSSCTSHTHPGLRLLRPSSSLSLSTVHFVLFHGYTLVSVYYVLKFRILILDNLSWDPMSRICVTNSASSNHFLYQVRFSSSLWFRWNFFPFFISLWSLLIRKISPI